MCRMAKIEGQEDNYVLEFFDGDSKGLSSDIYDNLDRFRGDNGLIRRWKVRQEIGDIENIEDVKRVAKVYNGWVQEDEYLVFQNITKNRFSFVKARKRGNDVYTWDKYKRFKDLRRLVEEKLNGINRERGLLKTNVIAVTLTYDPSLCSIQEASCRVTKDWHTFVECMKRKYGKFIFIRVLEYHKNGYPHIHGVLFFENVLFNCFRYNGKVRVVRKREMEKYWHSFMDVVGIIDDNGLKNGIGYLLKYILKSIEDGNVEDDYTLPLSWYFGKRSYGMSRDFFDLIKKCIIEAGCEDEIVFLGIFREDEVRYYMLLEYERQKMNLIGIKPPPGPTT